MIITCEKCGTRFNLDESLLDADGSKVRCSRCQHIFTAFPPPAKPEFDDFGFQDTDFDKDLEFDASDFDVVEDLPKEVIQETVEFEKLELETIDPDETEIEFEKTETAIPDEPDLSDELKSSEEPDLSETMDDPHKELELGGISSQDDGSELEDQSWSHSLEETDPLDKTTKINTDQKIDADQKDGFEHDEANFDGLDAFNNPNPDETDMDDSGSPDMPSHEPFSSRRPARASLIHPLDRADDPMDFEKSTAKKKTRIGRPVQVLIILFLLVGGGYIAATFLGYKIPFLPEIQIPFIEQYLPGKTPETVTYKDPIPDQKSVTGRFLTNDNAGELFIITGKIENPAQIPYRYIQVKGTLFQKEKQAAVSQMAFCGNIIPEETLKTGRIEDLTAQLKIPGGTADINEKIMPGDTVPFMLVFADLPRNLENFTVEVAGFEKVMP